MKNLYMLIFALCCCGSIMAQNHQASSAATPVKLHKSVLIQNQKQNATYPSANLSSQNSQAVNSKQSYANSPKCLADEITANYISEQTQLNPDFTIQLNKMYGKIQKWMDDNPNYLQQKALKTVPVVVHVVYNTPDENVSDALIYDMINTLNEDFQRLNSDTSQTRAIFLPDAADAQIEFCLAQRDPNNNPTNGITRTSTAKTYFDPDTETDDMKKNSTGGKDAWDPFNYLNIWIADIDNGAGFGIAGYAYLPTPGMHGSWRDGLVLDNNIGLCMNCRTATHEIGHYLGLKHTWGNNPPSCSNDDGFSDTPLSANENYGCNTSQNTCNEGGGDKPDQIENYMSYADCQNMFSTLQANYMNSVLNTTRNSLLNSQACAPTAPPVADFTADKDTLTAGQYAQFTDLTTGGATSWSWSFGGGGTPNTSVFQNPFIQFNTIGTYDVSLTATNSLGSDTETKISYITVLPDTTNCDTINWSFLSNDTSLTIYGCGVGCGYVVGTNQYDDLAKAQLFTAPEYSPNTHITGGLFYFAYAYKSGTSNAKVVFTVWDNDGTGGAPNTVLGTDTVDLADIVSDVQGGYLTQSLFIPPVAVSGDYYYGFQMVNFDNWAGGTSDSLALVQTLDGVSASASIPWEFSDLGSGYQWNDFITAWGFTSNTIFATPYMTDMPPTASFTADTLEGCGSLIVNFDASSSANGIDFYWDVDGDDTLDYLTSTPDISIEYTGAGTYSIALWVEGACDGLDSMKINNYITVYDVPALSASSTNASCGLCDGTATVSPSGGTTPYSYLWNDPAPAQITATATGLCPGTYNVLVSDANNCFSSSGTSVIDGGGLTISTTAANENCGAGNGTATAIVAGIPQTINISVDNFQFTPDSANANIGDTISWNWVGGSHTTTSDVIPGGASAWDNPINSGSTNFKYVVTQAGVYNYYCTPHQGMGMVGVINVSTPAYTYTWSTSPVQTAATATGLSSGTYNVTATDGSGCFIATDFFSAAVVNNTIDTVDIISFTVADVTCNGDSDGSATVNDTSGTTPYSYQWSNGQTSETATGLAAGNYSVTVTDVYGCTGTDSVAINEPTALVIDSIEFSDVSCNGGSDGFAEVFASGGTNPLQYNWETSGGTFIGDTAAISNLSAETYVITVTDANGCTDNSSVTISEPSPLVLSPTVDTAACFGDSASTYVNVSGGTSPYAYLWDNGNNGPGGGFQEAGTYGVTVTDANNCVADTFATVSDPAQLISNFNFKNISCFGANDGMAWVNPSGGTAPYSINWLLGETTDTVSNLAPGNAAVMVTDANGCFTNDSAEIIEPTELVIDSIEFSDVSCNGGNNGFAEVFVSGGTTPYSYLWSNNETTSQISNITSQIYSVTVTDDNDCSANSSVTISEPQALVIDSIILVSPQCSGDTSAMASVYVSGGVSPYFFNWSNGANGPGNSVQGPLPAGNYSVSITDSNNCSIDSSFTISQPTLLTATLSSTDETLPAANDGTATASPSGGTGGYNYNWSNSGTTQTISNLSPGSYIVTITDDNNCEFVDSVFINAAGCLLVIDSVSKTDVLCFGGNNGAATVYPSSGSGTYSYVWTNGQTTQTSTGLTAQSYSVTVTDDLVFGCKKNTSVFISQPAALVDDTIQVTPALCNGGNGSATSTPSGGVSPYTFLWSMGGTGATEDSIIAGNYSVTITDANTCTVVKSFTITQPVSPLTGSVTVTDESCSGCNDGTATATVSGGTSPYSFVWNTGEITFTISGLSPGTYCITVVDNNGCTDTACGTVNAYVCSMTATASGMDVSACASNDGMAMSSANGGDSPYTYLWSNSDTTQDIGNLSGGNYIVTITDSKNCTAVDSITVTDENFSIQIDSIVASNASCNGVCDGSAKVFVSGGQLPYIYIWSDGSTSNPANALCDGIYIVTVTESGGNCTAIDSITISEPSALSNIMTTVDESSAGASDGDAAANPSGGTPPYFYDWDNGETTQTITGLTAGTYYLTITDSNGCTLEDSAIINTAAPIICLSSTPYGNTDAPTNDIPATIDACNYAGEVATVDLISSGETYQFSTSVSTDWLVLTNTNDSVLVQGTTAITWTATFSGAIYLHIFADSACGIEDSCRISSVQCLSCPAGNPPACVGTLAYGNQTAPSNNTETVIDSCNWAGDYATVTAVDSGQTYQFSSGTSTDWLTLTDASNNLLVEGFTPISWLADFSGNVRLHIHTDSACGTENACRITYVQCVSCCAGFTASANATDETAPGANDGTVTVSVSGGTAPYTYNWNSGGTTQTITGLAPGFYNVSVTDSAGCTAQYNNALVNAAGCNMTASATVSDSLLCNGDNSGEATIAITNGSAPFFYQWSNGDSTDTASNLSAGNYTVAVQDDNGCIASASVTLTEPPAVSAVVSTSNPLCNGDSSGTATFSSSGGTGTLTYNWSNGGTGNSQTNLWAGNYSVTVSDDNACSIIVPFAITEPSALAVSVSTTDETSAGADDGTATANASGGTSPYSYNWNNAETTSSINNLAPATYAVTVTDDNGCETSASGIVNPFGCNLALTGISNTNVSCNGGNDGTATANISGGTSPVSYNWSNGDTTAMASGLSAGNHSVTVTDDAGCGVVGAVSITQPASALTMGNFTITDESCVGCNDGIISGSASGGTTPYLYQWDNGQNTLTATGLSPGTHCITITDANGCTVSNCADVLAFVCNLSATVTATDETAAGANDGTATAATTGGNLPYSYLWSNNETTDSISGLAPANYCVTVTDADNCTATACDSVAPGPNSISEINSDLSFVIYPNPNDGKFQLSVIGIQYSVKAILIYNILGETVYSKQLLTYKEQLSTNLSSGVYFVVLETEKGTIREKLIVE